MKHFCLLSALFAFFCGQISSPAAPAKPNILLILADDLGYGDVQCYNPQRGKIPTPNLDRLASQGMRFTDAHTSSGVCSPTRYNILTGRYNWRSRLKQGVLGGFSPPLIEDGRQTVAAFLRAQGYHTAAVGKWHLAPMEQCSAAGPFDQWPLARGFNRFYGFLDGETDQFHPELVADNHPVDPPGTPESGYHVSEDLVDNALRIIGDFKGVRPDRPFLGYVAFGATHAPHQAPPEYMAKYKGKYDEG